MAFQQVAILGMGLIGGSVARAVRACLPQTELRAMDTDPAALKIARDMQLADLCTHDPQEAARGASLVVLAVPVPALAGVARRVLPVLQPGTVVTDVASVKRLPVQEIMPLLPDGIAFVPAHPIAGSERTGAQAGSATLFAGKRVILTPVDPESSAVARVAAFWQALQAEVHYMPAELHDRLYACLSHLPQYLAFAVRDLYAARHIGVEGDAAFQRFSRLWRSDEALWRGIFEANADFIGTCLSAYLKLVCHIRGELAEGKETPSSGDMTLAAEVLFPRIAASCLVAVAHRVERELHVPLKAYIGTGFKDFTAPALEPPEPHLALISDHAGAVMTLLDAFIASLERPHDMPVEECPA